MTTNNDIVASTKQRLDAMLPAMNQFTMAMAICMIHTPKPDIGEISKLVETIRALCPTSTTVVSDPRTLITHHVRLLFAVVELVHPIIQAVCTTYRNDIQPQLNTDMKQTNDKQGPTKIN